MDVDSEALLKAWGLEEYIQVFKEEKIDSAALSLLTEDLVKELIKPIGDRAKFWANLQQWRGILAIANNTNLITDLSFNSEEPCTSRNEDEIATTNSENSEQNIPTPELQSPEIVEILSSSNEGKALLLKTEQILDNSSRSKLCDLVIQAELKNNPDISITSSRLMNLTGQIVTVFKKEHSSTYFIPYISYGKNKKTAKGKLLSSLHKYKRRYRKIGLINSRRSSSSSTSTITDKPNEIDFDINDIIKSTDEEEEIPDEILNQIQWLQNSSEPLDRAREYWNNTTKHRLKHHLKSDEPLHEYMKKYPVLKKPNGYIFLEDDFLYMYKNANSLLDIFPLYKKKIIEKGKEKALHLRDPALRGIIHMYEQNTDEVNQEEADAYAAFSILPYLLQPNTIRPAKAKSSKTWRPSRSEIKDGFITEVAGGQDLLKVISDRKEKLEKLGFQFQPMIVTVRKEIGNNDYYVVIDNTFFLRKSICEAVDCCFKCIHALHAQYAPEAAALWTFIQLAFYKLKTPWDQRYVTVATLLTDLGICIE